jgi:hypothetical protein
VREGREEKRRERERGGEKKNKKLSFSWGSLKASASSLGLTSNFH